MLCHGPCNLLHFERWLGAADILLSYIICLLINYLFSSNYGDWWLAKHLKSGLTGYIPSNYVVMDDNRPESQEWVFSLLLLASIVSVLSSANY